MPAYYNEIDLYAAKWLRNLIAAGHIAPGDVDERSIVEVRADDLRGYGQCHFFAGIGGWSHALRLAGWPDDRAVWTGSCPCQPLSSAGQQKGHVDERHLWPAFYELIAECRPATVFGEQVASKLGREWMAAVRSDLEAARYAVGAADLPAAGIGAPHLRSRLFWLAHSPSGGQREQRNAPQPGSGGHANGGVVAGGMANSEHAERWPLDGPREDERHGPNAGRSQAHGQPGACGEVRAVGDAESNRWQRPEGEDRQPDQGGGRQGGLDAAGAGADVRSFWSDAVWLKCTDGKTRPTKPGIHPLAYGLSGRMVIRRAAQQGAAEAPEEHWYSRTGTLRGAGNAIVPQVAAEFIQAAEGLTS